MNQHSIGDGIIVAAVMAAFIAYFYFKNKTRLRRLEVIHQERLAAMDKGIPLPELPIDPPEPSSSSAAKVLMHGIVWLAFSLGGMIVLYLILPSELHKLWVTPLPLTFLGIGLALYYVLLSREQVR